MKEKKQSLIGTTAYGYQRKDGFLIEDPTEQDVISEMRRLQVEKNYSLRRIAAFLNESFIPSKQNGLWYSNVVGAILERERPVIENNKEDSICLNGDEK